MTTTNAVNTMDVNDLEESLVMDEFGRTEAERTVVLGSREADAINNEVIAGKHNTYDDALAYVIARGFAEITRARKAAEELRQARIVKEQGKLYTAMLEANPALVTDPKFVAKMIAALGVKTK